MALREIVANQATAILRRITRPPNASIVFDIDDTLIDSKSNTPIVPVVNLYHKAREMGYIPFIVTNRAGGHDYYTNYQLEKMGIVGYKTIYFRRPREIDFWGTKRAARKHITEQGYNIVMSVGDKPWDIGDYGGYGIIIPDSSSAF